MTSPSKKVREEAALLCQLTVAYPYIVTRLVADSIGAGQPALDLMFDAVRDLSGTMRYAEAEARLRTGWCPGDEP